MNVKIRIARPEDGSVLLAIYSFYITNTAVTFEYDIPSAQEFSLRISETLKNYPYLVAEVDGKIAGYAYASRFRSRAAFAWAAETSIYLGQEFTRLGLGRLLYENLEKILSRQHVTNLYACIAAPNEDDDPYLTKNSQLFHASVGYKKVGLLTNCASKFGKWYNLVYMEKIISDYDSPPEDFISFRNL